MQAQSRRSSICFVCVCAHRARPSPPRPALPQAAALHVSAPLWRVGGASRRPVQKYIHGPSTPSRTPATLVKRSAMAPAGIRRIVFGRIDTVRETIKNSALVANMDVTETERKEHWEVFANKLRRSLHQVAKMEAPISLSISGNEAENAELLNLWERLQQAYKLQGVRGIDRQLEHTFLGHVASSKNFSPNDFQNQRALADLRYPTEWYPSTRKMQRKIIMHVGPTNSGKTYHALKRLEEAKSGVYAGPLRLLAHEVYSRMNAKGISCCLVTGEERRRSYLDRNSPLVACTVEMMPLNRVMEVAVIDEIQLIGDAERGWAWTQALLGVQANEVHLCGEERTVPLIRELAAAMGDSIEICTYRRLTPLKIDDQSVGYDFRKLRKGDCIVSFSVVTIHALRQRIQKQTGKNVAIVYGSLPPETRAQQARLFNDPDSGYDILVASDAIGMGLNLSIKRIIFERVDKFNGFEEIPLTIAQTKQIAGRAGRYKSAHEANKEAGVGGTDQGKLAPDADDIPVTTLEDVAARAPLDRFSLQRRKHREKESFEFAEPKPGGGLVTALETDDMNRIRRSLQMEAEPIRTAGLFPPDAVLERFANYFPPGTPFSYVLLRLHEISRVHTRFHMCILKDQLHLADAIQQVQGLTVRDRIIICAAPASAKSDAEKQLLHNLATCIAEKRSGNILEIEGFEWELLDRPISADRAFLKSLESLHKAIVLYLWLSYRFSGAFGTRALAFHAKTLAEQAIEATLTAFSRSKENIMARKERKDRMKQLQGATHNAEAEEEEGQKMSVEGGRYERDDELGMEELAADILDGAEKMDDIRPADVSKVEINQGGLDESSIGEDGEGLPREDTNADPEPTKEPASKSEKRDGYHRRKKRSERAARRAVSG